MKSNVNRLAAVLGIVVVLLGWPVAAQGQQKLEIDGRVGAGIPAGDLADIADVGPAVGVKVAYRLNPRFALRADGEVEVLDGADLDSGAQAPDLTLWHYGGGVELQVLEPNVSRWSLVANAGIGATTFNSDDFSDAQGGGDFNETYFTFNTGAEVGYNVRSNVRLFVGAQAHVMFADEDDTVAFAALSPEVDNFGTVVSVPITGGVSFKL